MALQMDKGLFSGDFMDHYAILGVPLDIDPKEIRKVYLTIARRLHPDSSSLTSESDRALAGQLLSKWVNPAWESLGQEKQRTEYNLLLKMKGQSASASPSQSVHLNSIAQQLLTAPNPDFFYRSALSDLTAKQFLNLEQTIEMTGRLSELNLAYIMRKQSSGENTISSTRPLYTIGAEFSETPPPGHPDAMSNNFAVAQRPVRESLAEPYFRRAEGYYKRSDYVRAIRELRDGLAIDTRHAPSHSMLGMAYFNQKQPTMARIHFDKALEINPDDEQAQVGKRSIERLNAANTVDQSKSKKPGGGFLGGLFGRK
jgi:curved DNA-binding protein CbpA